MGVGKFKESLIIFCIFINFSYWERMSGWINFNDGNKCNKKE